MWDRRTLCRGKREDNGQWIYGRVIYTAKWVTRGLGNCLISIQSKNFGEGEHLIVRETLGQYTGLTDKNDKQIFEGDIVEFMGKRGKVVFECGAYGIGFNDNIDYEQLDELVREETGNWLDCCHNDNFISFWEILWNFNETTEYGSQYVEVIGNYYDNYELLLGE